MNFLTLLKNALGLLPLIMGIIIFFLILACYLQHEKVLKLNAQLKLADQELHQNIAQENAATAQLKAMSDEQNARIVAAEQKVLHLSSIQKKKEQEIANSTVPMDCMSSISWARTQGNKIGQW